MNNLFFFFRLMASHNHQAFPPPLATGSLSGDSAPAGNDHGSDVDSAQRGDSRYVDDHDIVPWPNGKFSSPLQSSELSILSLGREPTRLIAIIIRGTRHLRLSAITSRNTTSNS